ncbi:MAG: GHKL domain-containing protein [Lachnoclostridium sp.]|nr:GHKL domain-containing protein [Lachnospira sp.]MCM1249009.1 GHKL domain-containing protein [Lachnoclostridium sp.]
MFYRLAVLWEIFSIVVCIHGIYNRRVKLDIETAGLFLAIIGILELVLQLKFNNITTLCIFMLMVFYCIHKFKDSISGAIISTLLMLLITGMLQFLFLLPFSRVGLKYEELRMLLINFLVAIFSIWLLPKMKIYKFREILRRREKFVFFVFLIALLIIFLITVEGKLRGEIHIAFFVFAVPILMVLLWAISKWDVAQNEKEVAQNELSVAKSMQEEYDDLLISVRLREHGFKNHLAALLSIKYTTKSYEELVQEQANYYGLICKENRYNKLLFLGDSTISGFLYEKFGQAEDEEIFVTYEQKGCFSRTVVPIYHLVEILGILFDNAIEAQIKIPNEKRMKFQFEEKETKYEFRILNPYPYASYAEIELWFLQNNSSKGKEHGLGLYYVKKLCEKYDMDILCRNIEYECENWIEMTLKVKKADKL